MAEIQAHTVQAPPTGRATAVWRERFGDQHASVDVNPGRTDGTEFSVHMERRWGPQLTDTRAQDFRLSRAGAVALRDALAAAIEWTPTPVASATDTTGAGA